MKRIVSTLLALILALSLVPTMAFAADKVTFGAKASKSSLTIGDEVEVTVSVNAIKASRGVAIYLNYDKSKVEYVSAAPETTTTLGKDADCDHLSAKSQVGFIAELKNATDVKASDLIKVKFKAIAEGEAVFTLSGGEAYYGEGASLAEYEVDQSATAKVSISKPVIKVTSVSVSPKTLTLEVGQNSQLTATVKPDEATDKTVTWKVTKGSDIVSVDADGKVTALKAGSATITATAGGKTATCTVTVKVPAHKHTPVAVPAQESTCKEKGWEAYYKCSECGTVVDKDGNAAQIVYLPLAAHKLTETKAVPATCTEDGTEAYWTCSVCEKMFADKDGKKEIKAPAKIAALGHDIGDKTLETAGVAGSKLALYSATCKNCNEKVYTAKLEMPANTLNVVAKQSADSKKDFSKAVSFTLSTSKLLGAPVFAIDPVTADIVTAAKTEAGYKVAGKIDKADYLGAIEYELSDYYATAEDAYAAMAAFMKDGLTFTQTISAKEKLWTADAKSHTMTFDINTADGTFTVKVDGKDESTVTFTNTFTYKKSTNNGGNTSTKDDNTKNDGKKVESGKTFDAGIAMYVGLSVLSVTGGALVIGKKKHF